MKPGTPIKLGKAGHIPQAYPDILIRLGIADDDWEQCIQYYEKRYPSVIGYLTSMRAFAQKQSKRWLKGIRHGFEFDMATAS